MSQYQCGLCEYVYEDSSGGDVSGTELGTDWENLPASWICPECGASKELFFQMEDSEQMI